MAPGEEVDSAQAVPPPPPPPLRPVPHPLRNSDDGEPLVGLWLGLLVALVATFIAWLWYGSDDEGNKEAAAAGGSPPVQERGAPGAEESLQRSYECVTSETKPTGVSSPQEPVGNQLAPPGEQLPETKPLVKETPIPLMNYTEYLRNKVLTYPTKSRDPPQSQEAEMHSVSTSSEAGAPGGKHEERCKEQLCHNSVDQEEWEIVPKHLVWGDAIRKSHEDPEQEKRVAAVSPVPQTIHVTFQVHYITHSEAQLIAITGDHECLGQWHRYVSLRCDKDGFWSDSVVLPVNTRVEWKFILVENGKVKRWEECDNRILVTELEDRVAHKWWGYH